MKKKLSEKISELEEKVDWFYGEDFRLDEASAKYKEATKMAKEIEQDLEELKNEIKIIEEDFTKES
ncbi:MAG: exodeoxyribonuclease VII small subunit [Candidatus Saccharibacteria bacterium]|nr:exodeoxyribonuclease VII small subunit [Candidatus Saccharibacteria bacterium]MDO4967754.1 exodeoxyribonuclease VII small subunit [Candidatus Saccharibacteria bacterium]